MTAGLCDGLHTSGDGKVSQSSHHHLDPEHHPIFSQRDSRYNVNHFVNGTMQSAEWFYFKLMIEKKTNKMSVHKYDLVVDKQSRKICFILPTSVN